MAVRHWTADNGNGTYTYYYHFWPGWEPATNGPAGGGGGGTGNPYVTNKEVQGFECCTDPIGIRVGLGRILPQDIKPPDFTFCSAL